MKKIFFLAFVLASVLANAQYFHHLYGTAANGEHPTSGINTTGPMPLGQFSTGITLTCLPGATVPAVYSDPAGNIPGAPFFERNFLLSTTAGNFLEAKGFSMAMEITTCPGILGITGSYTDANIPGPGNTGVYFMQVLPGGAPGPIFSYSPPAGFDIEGVFGIAQSVIAPNEWYACGTARDVNGIFYPFAIKFDECTGALVWGQIYSVVSSADPVWGRDIEESLGQPFGFPGAAIVGEMDNAGSRDGYLFHIDATNGLPAPNPVLVFGTPNTHDAIRSISQAQPSNFPPGFILSGYTDLNGTIDFLAVRVDDANTAFFSNTFDYSLIAGSDNYAYNAIQRLNSTCTHEYYIVGNTRTGVFGGADIMVVKMDQWGNGVAGGEYHYGGTGNDFGMTLDKRDMNPCGAPAPLDGLSIFSTWGSPGIGGADMMLIKAYFNGVSTNGAGCKEILKDPVQNGGLWPVLQMMANPLANINGGPNLSAISYALQDLTLCFANTIPGGSNNRVAAPDDDKDEAILVMPNPAETGRKLVTLQVESEVDGPVKVEIFDILGKLYYSQQHTLTKGVNNLPLDIEGETLAAGMYSVKMSSDTDTKTVMLMVK